MQTYARTICLPRSGRSASQEKGLEYVRCGQWSILSITIGPFLELKPDAHGAETTFLTREPRTAHPVCLNALRIIPTCRARYGEVIHSHRHKMSHSVFCLLKIQRHHDTVR